MAVTDLDTLIAAFGSPQLKTPTKYGAGNSANTNYWNSSWRMTGSNYPASLPSTGAGDACDATTAGRIIVNNPSGSNKLYLARFNFSPNIACSAILMDRLVQTSGLVANVNTLQNVNTVALPTRGGNGDDVEMWLEVYTQIGATPATLTVTYTNQVGTTGRVATLAIPATVRATTTMRIPLASGDTGVRSVQSVQLSVSTGTAGNFGITLAKRILGSPAMVVNSINGAGPISMGLPEIPSDSCLYLITTASGTTSPTYDAELLIAEG